MYAPENQSQRSDIEVRLICAIRAGVSKIDCSFQKVIRDMREVHDNKLMQQLEEMENRK